jgi:hypothetical protein
MIAYVEGKLFNEEVIYVAIPPVFVGFVGLDHRVVGGVEMFGGMFVLRVIAASHVPASLAETQMHPGIAHL